ncbi:MAG: PEP-CTERM sorting domain-containing protein [Rhodospirillaceae bacterium]|jgi:hypothetical protein|nr:PEP-CTERM sorting domain-containing protein [Rhodospirillaceae bacterium]
MPKFKHLLAAAAVSALTLASVSSANAAIMVDPGPNISTVTELTFTVMPGDIVNNGFDVEFDNMKHVELLFPTTIDILVPPPGTIPPGSFGFYFGTFYLTDEFHNELLGTSRSFIAQAGAPTTLLGAPFDPIIFHDFHFEFDQPVNPNDPNDPLELPMAPFEVTIFFNDGNKGPVVGLWGIPEPGTLAIFGLGLLGLGLIRRQKRAA